MLPAGTVRGVPGPTAAPGAHGLRPHALPPCQHPEPAGLQQLPADTGGPFHLTGKHWAQTGERTEKESCNTYQETLGHRQETHRDTYRETHWDTYQETHWDTNRETHWDTNRETHWDTYQETHWNTYQGTHRDTYRVTHWEKYQETHWDTDRKHTAFQTGNTQGHTTKPETPWNREETSGHRQKTHRDTAGNRKHTVTQCRKRETRGWTGNAMGHRQETCRDAEQETGNIETQSEYCCRASKGLLSVPLNHHHT